MSHNSEEISIKLPQVEILAGQGIARACVIRAARITEQTYQRWPSNMVHKNRPVQRVQTPPEGEQAALKAVFDFGVPHRSCIVAAPFYATKRPKGCGSEDRLIEDMIELTDKLGCYGYHRIAALLWDAVGSSPASVWNIGRAGQLQTMHQQSELALEI